VRRIEDVGQMRAGRLSEQELPAMIPELQDYRLERVWPTSAGGK